MAYYMQYEDVDREPNDLVIGDHVQIIRNCDNEADVKKVVEIVREKTSTVKYILEGLPRFRFRREELCKMIWLEDYKGFTGYSLYYRWKKTGLDGRILSTKQSCIFYKGGCYNWRGKKLCGPGPERIKVEKTEPQIYLFCLIPPFVE